MSRKNNCIISFATKQGNYAQGLARLSDSLRHNFEGDFLAWVHEKALGAPAHADNPYAFKVHAFLKAFEAGYDNVLWLDCSVYAVKNVQPIFDIINRQDYFFQEAGHLLGEWSNDALLDFYNIDRDTAMGINMVMGGIMGLRKNSEVLTALRVALNAGIFKGQWTNELKSESKDERCLGHRHEMSAVSAIVHKMGLSWSDQINQYAGAYDPTPEHIILKLQGL